MKHPLRLQKTIGAVLTIFGLISMASIDFAPGLIGFLKANPPLLILSIFLIGSGVALFIEAFPGE